MPLRASAAFSSFFPFGLFVPEAAENERGREEKRKAFFPARGEGGEGRGRPEKPSPPWMPAPSRSRPPQRRSRRKRPKEKRGGSRQGLKPALTKTHVLQRYSLTTQ